jgi:hypothetical protein
MKLVTQTATRIIHQVMIHIQTLLIATVFFASGQDLCIERTKNVDLTRERENRNQRAEKEKEPFNKI